MYRPNQPRRQPIWPVILLATLSACSVPTRQSEPRPPEPPTLPEVDGTEIDRPDIDEPGIDSPDTESIAEPEPPPTTTAASTYLLAQAIELIDQRSLQLAAATLDRALRIDPASPEAYFEYARLRYLQSNLDQAREFLQRARSLSPDSALTKKIDALWQETEKTMQAQ